jgi:thiamine pyrophosphokinase
LSTKQRAVIFANGELNHPDAARRQVRPGDLLIAADGGARLCSQLGLSPDVLIGDFDSLKEAELADLTAKGTQVIQHPMRKDYTDLELALRHAHSLGIEEAIVVAALGARWDQTLANLLLPASKELAGMSIRLADGPQEVYLLQPGEVNSLQGRSRDTVSLIPLGGDALGVTTHGLEYPLQDETLYFGATRGLSNVLLGQQAQVILAHGLLLCVVIHAEGRTIDDDV